MSQIGRHKNQIAIPLNHCAFFIKLAPFLFVTSSLEERSVERNGREFRGGIGGANVNKREDENFGKEDEFSPKKERTNFFAEEEDEFSWRKGFTRTQICAQILTQIYQTFPGQNLVVSQPQKGNRRVKTSSQFLPLKLRLNQVPYLFYCVVNTSGKISKLSSQT